MSKLPPLPKDFAAFTARAAISRAIELNAAGQHVAAAVKAQEALAHKPDDAEALYELGIAALSTGRHEAAIAAFRRVLRGDPRSVDALAGLASALRAHNQPAAALQEIDAALALAPYHPSLHHNRGNILMALNRREEATASYRTVLGLKPDHEGAAYMLKSLTGGTTPEATPPAFVAAMFDQYAEKFEEHLTGSLGYRTPSLIAAMLPGAVGTVLDLGCGTGLVATALTGRFSAIDGVDLSPRMIEKCRLKGLYRDLAVGEIGAYLSGATTAGRHYDLVVAADVFVYIGALDAVFRDTAAVLAPAGLFVFSLEHAEDGEFVLQPSGRYAHGQDYIRNLAAAVGFAVERVETAVLRREHGHDIDGRIVMLRKASGGE